MIEQYLNPETICSIIAIDAGGMWLRLKGKLTEFRNLIVSVDDEVKDDRITEEEFKGIWDTAKKVFAIA